MSFKKNILFIGGTQLIVFILGFLMSILNARMLGPEGIGVISLLYTLRMLSVRISDFGFGTSLRYFSANKGISYMRLKKVVSRYSIPMTIVIILLSIGLRHLPINVWNKIDTLVFHLFLLSLVFYVLNLYLRHLIHGQLLIKTYNLSEILEKAVYLFSFIIFVLFMKLGLVGAMLSLIVSSFFIFIFLIISISNYTGNYSNQQAIVNDNSFSDLKKMWNYGKWSYLGMFIQYLVENLPIIYFKSKIDSFIEIGYFNKGKGLAEYPKIATIPIAGLLLSYNAGQGENKALARTAILSRISVVVLTVLFLFLSFFIRPIITFLYGKEFLPAADLFLLFYPSVVFYTLNLYLTSSIAALGLIREIFIIRLKSLPFVFILGWLLITYYGVSGTVLTISMSSFILWIQYIIKYVNISKTKYWDLLILKKEDIFMVINMVKKH